MKKVVSCLMTIWIIFMIVSVTHAQTNSQIGIRGGLGTDINLGLAYGVGGNFLLDLPNNELELGILLFGGSFKEETDEGLHTYKEKTDIFLFGLIANLLHGYAPRQQDLFYITGVGLASINVEWEEKSDTDTSLGPLLPGGGSMQTEEGSAGGMVFNLGIGKSFINGTDFRVELPVIVTFAPPGGASSVIPTLIATLGIRL